MNSDITLREMTAADGAQLKALMENDPDTGEMHLTTKFLVDPFVAWTTLKTDLAGVVAVTGDDEVVGCATVSFSHVRFNDRMLPCGFLENVKVHHEHRGKGIGGSMTDWLIDRATERYGDDCVIASGTSSDNTASQATMRHWARQTVDSVIVVPGTMLYEEPAAVDGLMVGAPEIGELADIVARSNAYYDDYGFWTPLDAEKLAADLNKELPVYHYRVAVDDSGRAVAGVMISTRGALMYDQFHNVPPPMRASGMVPPDERLRFVECGHLWYEDLETAKVLWDFVRWDMRELGNSIAHGFDHRSPISELFPVDERRFQFNLVLSIGGPELLDDSKLIGNHQRG